MHKSFLRQSLLALSHLSFGVVASTVLAFGTQVMLARELAPENYGALVSVLAIITLISALANAGVPGFWLRVFGRERRAGIRWLGTSFQLVSCSVALVLIMAWLWAYLGPHDDLSRRLVLYLSPLIIGQVAIDLMHAKLQFEERYELLGIWQLLQNLLRFVWVLGVVLIFDEAMLNSFAAGFLVVSIIIIMLAFRPLRRLSQGSVELPDSESLMPLQDRHQPVNLRGVAVQSFPFALAGMMYVVYFQSDIILLNYLGSSEAAGIYNVAFTVMAAVYLFPNIIYQKFLLPKLHRWKNHDRDQFVAINKLGSKLMLVSGLLVMVLIWVIVPWAIPLLFGLEYKDAVFFLVILAVCAPFRFLASSVASRLLSHEEVQLKVLCMVIVAVINVLLNFLVIPIWGGTGAAVTTLISEILLLIFFFIATKNQRSLGE